MGMTKGAIKRLGREIADREYVSAASYGVQSIIATMSEVKRIISELGGVWTQSEGEAIDSAVFRSLGCGSLETLDIYSAGNSTHVIDLNLPVSESYRNKCELICDGGSLEHCFNVPEVLRNTERMLRMGGRVIHHTPMNNWVDYGFYQISPTLFLIFIQLRVLLICG